MPRRLDARRDRSRGPCRDRSARRSEVELTTSPPGDPPRTHLYYILGHFFLGVSAWASTSVLRIVASDEARQHLTGDPPPPRRVHTAASRQLVHITRSLQINILWTVCDHIADVSSGAWTRPQLSASADSFYNAEIVTNDVPRSLWVGYARTFLAFVSLTS
jgi:hypothetical protein